MPGLFDPELDPSLIEGGGAPLDLPQPQKPGSKWKELAPLLALLPMALKQGGRVGGAALLQGFQQSRQRGEELSRRDALAGEQRSYRDRQMASLEEQRAAAAENAELQRRQAFLTQFSSGLEGLDTPEAAQAYIALQALQGDALGVPRAQLEAMAPAPTALQQRAAKKRLADLDKQFGEKLTEMGPQFMYELPGEPKPVTFDELLSRAGQAKDPNFVAPKDDAKPETRSLDVQAADALARGDQATYQRLLKVKKEMGQADDRPRITIDHSDKPLTPYQRAQLTSSRRKEWDSISKVINDRQFAVAKVDSGLAALKRGDRVSATQTIITAFNKLQDETSVVREGEYARSEDLAPLLSRIEAGLTKLVYGGGKLTDAQLIALGTETKNIARALSRVSEGGARDKRAAIEEELKELGIPASRIFGGSTVGRPLADPGGIR
jgi:hypothetical protein